VRIGLPGQKSRHHHEADAGDNWDGCESAECQHHNFVFRFLIHVALRSSGAQRPTPRWVSRVGRHQGHIMRAGAFPVRLMSAGRPFAQTSLVLDCLGFDCFRGVLAGIGADKALLDRPKRQ
jgi:hypothetical protein